MADNDKKYSESELKDYIAALRKKDREEAEAKEILQKEPVHKSADNLKKIGELIVDRKHAGKKSPKNIDKVTETAFDNAVDYIETNEKEMEDSNDDQRRIYGQVKETLIAVRTSTSFEELEANRKKLESLQRVNDSIRVDGNNLGEIEARDFVEKLLNKLIIDSKPSKVAHVLGVAKKGLFSQEGTVIGSAMKEFGFIADFLRMPKTRGEPATYEKEIERLSRIESLPAVHYKKPALEQKSSVDTARQEFQAPETASQPATMPPASAQAPEAQSALPVAKEFDPGIVTKKASIGETTTDPTGKTYEKIATGWKDLETGKVVKRHKQSAIENIYSQNKAMTRPSVSSTNKVSTMTVDKIIAKSIVVEKADKKPAPIGRVENKPFNANLLGDDKQTETQEPASILDTIKNALGIGVLGGGPKKSIGGLARLAGTVLSRASLPVAAGLAAASPFMMSEHGMEANPNETENYKLSKPISEMGAWEKFTNKVGAKRQSIEEMIDAGKTFDEKEASDIRKYYEIEVPQKNLMVNPKPTMMEHSAQEIPKATERVEARARELGSAPVIVNQVTPAAEQPAPSIIPVRGSVRPNESSFKRFQDKNFKA